MDPKLISLLVEDDEVGEGTARINADVQQLGSRPRRDYLDNALISHLSTEADGQTRPTPLVFKYGTGDYNCLHQDFYGEHVFPIQIVILLSDETAFDGGEFVLTEQRPRMQSRTEVIRLRKGAGLAFAVNQRSKQGTRGYYRVKQRHGVSSVRAGQRFTLGIIFHDAA